MDNEFSIKKLREDTKKSHEKYFIDNSILFIEKIKDNIRANVKKGYYQWSTSSSSLESSLGDFWRNVSNDEWNKFILDMKNEFSELEIRNDTTKYPYWINFDWSEEL